MALQTIAAIIFPAGWLKKIACIRLEYARAHSFARSLACSRFAKFKTKRQNAICTIVWVQFAFDTQQKQKLCQLFCMLMAVKCQRNALYVLVLSLSLSVARFQIEPHFYFNDHLIEFQPQFLIKLPFVRSFFYTENWNQWPVLFVAHFFRWNRNVAIDVFYGNWKCFHWFFNRNWMLPINFAAQFF